MLKEIELTRGEKVLVDGDVFEELNKYKWYFDGGYAVRNIRLEDGSRYSEKMHRIITKAVGSEMVDHINGNTLDNRRSNLRNVTRRQNNMNARKKTPATSRYKGVFFFKRKVDVFGRWCTKIQVDYKVIKIGYFDSEIEAALAYNKAAKEYFGEYAVFNEIELLDFQEYQKKSNSLRSGQWFRTSVSEHSTKLSDDSIKLEKILKESLPSGEGLDVECVAEKFGEILHSLSNLATALKIDLNDVALKNINNQEETK